MADNQQAAGNQAQPQFALQRIYVKDLSFESPNSPLIFQEQWKPQVNLDLNTSHNKISDNQYEVVVSLTITAKLGDKVAYIVEVQQAGVFLVHGIEEPQLGQMLGAYCPNILFPYARETIDNLVNNTLHALMLDKCADTMIGGELIKGISGGQKKRTSIAIEMVTSPSVIM